MTPVVLTSDQNAEVTFISGVDASGDVAATSYFTWDSSNTASTTYTGASFEAKWGDTVAGAGSGVLVYAFAAASKWTAAEQTAFVMTLDLWAAEANVSFVEGSRFDADIVISRGSGTADSNGGVNYYPSPIGSSHLGEAASGEVTINTSASGEGPLDGSFSADGGYPWQVLLHEEGHALGLGHAGPYNGTVDPSTQQLGVYDAREWSLMSYIDPEATGQANYAVEPVQSGDWGTTATGKYLWDNTTVTPGALDILAIQRLYGLPVTTPLSGGQTFGFDCNIAGPIEPFFDFTQNTTPVVTLWDEGAGNTLDLSGYATPSTINLNPGDFSSCAGLTHNIDIAFGVQIDKAVGGSGNDTLIANNDGDALEGGPGNDTLIGGAGLDTALYDVASTQASWTFNGAAWIVSAGADGTDTLTNIEQLQFTDRTVALANLGFVAAGSQTSAALRGDPAQPVLYATGGVLFADADSSGGAHGVSVTAAAGDFGALSATVERDSSGGSQGLIVWQYAVNDAAVASLAPGQFRTDAFTLTVSGGYSPPAAQQITVTLGGGGSVVNTVSGGLSVSTVYDPHGGPIGQESAQTNGGTTVYTYADGSGQVYAHRVTQDLGGGSFEYQDFDAAYDQRDATIHYALGNGVTQDESFDGAWSLIAAVRTSVAGAQTVTQDFNGAWSQTSASIVTTAGASVVTQTFDGAWSQTSARIVTTNGSTTIDQQFDGRWNQTSAQITQQLAANVTEEQVFNGAWQQTSAQIITVDGISTIDQRFDAGWNFLGAAITNQVSPDLQVVRTYDAHWTETGITEQAFAFGQTAAQSFTGTGTPTTYVFHPGQIDGDSFTAFASGAGGVAAHDVLEFVGYGAGAHLTQLDATHWQVGAIGRASEIFTIAGLSPASGDATFVG
jgi:hypothetical protein